MLQLFRHAVNLLVLHIKNTCLRHNMSVNTIQESHIEIWKLMPLMEV